MAIKDVKKLSFFWKSTVLSFALLMNVALGYSLLLGEQSIFAWNKLYEKYDSLQGELELVNQKQAELSRQIRLLQNDPNYVEQLIRQRLNYVRENEILYLFEKEQEEPSLWLEQDTENNG